MPPLNFYVDAPADAETNALPPQDAQPAPESARPQMTEKELSLQLARAGLQARAEAEATASDPQATSALRDAASPRVLVRGVPLGRLSFGALWVLRDAGSVFAGPATDTHLCPAEVGLAVQVLSDPIGSHLLQSRRGTVALRALGASLAFTISPAEGTAAMEWINAEFCSLNDALDTPDECIPEATGKKP